MQTGNHPKDHAHHHKRTHSKQIKQQPVSYCYRRKNREHPTKWMQEGKRNLQGSILHPNNSTIVHDIFFQSNVPAVHSTTVA